jgi:hypothetical protein
MFSPSSRTLQKAGMQSMPAPRFDRQDTIFWSLSGGRSDWESTNKNIFVKIICIMVDVMYEIPERDVFY